MWRYVFCNFVLFQRAIEYLLPSSLFDKKARPQMKVSANQEWCQSVRYHDSVYNLIVAIFFYVFFLCPIIDLPDLRSGIKWRDLVSNVYSPVYTIQFNRARHRAEPGLV